MDCSLNKVIKKNLCDMAFVAIQSMRIALQGFLKWLFIILQIWTSFCGQFDSLFTCMSMRSSIYLYKSHAFVCIALSRASRDYCISYEIHFFRLLFIFLRLFMLFSFAFELAKIRKQIKITSKANFLAYKFLNEINKELQKSLFFPFYEWINNKKMIKWFFHFKNNFFLYRWTIKRIFFY